MNLTEAGKLLAYANSFDTRVIPKDPHEADLRVQVWVDALVEVPINEAAEIVRNHYHRTDELITVAGIRRVHDARQDRQGRVLAQLDRRRRDGDYEPPKALKDHSQPCADCGAKPGETCRNTATGRALTLVHAARLQAVNS